MCKARGLTSDETDKLPHEKPPGSSLYEKNGIYGQIVALVVEQEHQGQHIGSSFVAEGERWLKTRGVQTIIVNSGTHRQAAHRFYEHLGYQVIGIRRVKTFE